MEQIAKHAQAEEDKVTTLLPGNWQSSKRMS